MVLTVILILLVLSVVGALALGLWNFFRGGTPNKSQLFMRWRVILQFGVIVLVLLIAYFSGS